MKVYLHLLQYSRPIVKYIGPFFIISTLATLFGVVNLTLLIPILNLLFGNVELQESMPEFSMSASYFKDYFNYFLTDIIQKYDKIRALEIVCVVLVGFVMLSNIFRYISARILVEFRLTTIAKLRNALYDKLVTLDLGYFTRTKRGEIISRVLTDTVQLEATLTNSIAVIFREPIKVVSVLVILFNISSELTLATLIVVPLSGIFISLIVKKMKRDTKLSQKSLGDLISILDETINGIRIILGFNAVDLMKKRFNDETETYKKTVRSLTKRTELSSPTSEFFGALVLSGILIYGGKLVLSEEHSLSASEFITFIILTSQLFTPIKTIFSSLVSYQKGLVSGERVLDILDRPGLIQDSIDAKDVNGLHKSIKFEKVEFGYNDESVINGIDFELEKGKMLALVGPSGGGKSTIADLVCRFYDVNDGRILFDEIDIREVKSNSLRANMGIVSQESILFNDTIHNNIAFGMVGATKTQVEEAARIANAHEFIIDMDDGYDTIIGEKGMRLSGGQRQRLSIARAVLKNPPLLILDEATSSLDSESESLVQEALNKLMENRTSIVIAHRLSTIMHADNILVIDKGRIIEQGKHSELIKRSGLYRQLSKHQFDEID